MMNGVMTQGLNGMQQSGQKMQQVAHDIARTGQPAEGGGRLGVNEPGGATVSTVGQNIGSIDDLAAQSVEMTRQEHIFTASAKVVSVADKALGTLLDMKA